MRRTKEDAARTREEVLAAAAEIFYENGVSGSSLEKIAQRAGVTRGAIYWHFKDKAEVLTALHREIRLPQETIVDYAIAHGHDDPLGLIENATIEVLQILVNDEHQQRVFAIMILGCEFTEHLSDAAQRIVTANAEMFGKLQKLIEMADERSRLAPLWTADAAARAIQCSMNGLLAEWLRSGKSFPLVDVGERLVRSLIHSMRGETSN
ncbi:TetR family transcriptional regulator [Rhizobium sp. P40RR-XXII]|uniref:TetR family transcriptional regulator n=1 Tax=unclassified Rhizobium TaxID=2613769 RepID=UPI001456C264|nr:MULTISPECIES: TetR family transcriptional regulator [unclassified Rhizobium]NLR85208.1 TetR family transcriptional regulator [Rhizobium sp. P28RR-XV]NLS16817.1 TetR family transcriptional regulator [Rhizobium sp. P40RR-XXII]